MRKHKHSAGYILVHIPNHPCAHNGLVYEHRVLMEKKLGRYLTERESVHHLNHLKSDNRIDNLVLCSSTEEHRRYDNGWIKEGGKWFKTCSQCKRLLEVNEENFHFRKVGRVGKLISPCKKCYRSEKMRAYNRAYQPIRAAKRKRGK